MITTTITLTIIVTITVTITINIVVTITLTITITLILTVTMNNVGYPSICVVFSRHRRRHREYSAAYAVHRIAAVTVHVQHYSQQVRGQQAEGVGAEGDR